MYRIIGWIGLAITAMISCSKPVPFKTSKLLVNLEQSALTTDQVDSADVVLRKAGTNTQVKEKFVKKGHHLEASLRSLTPGTWNADLAVYTKAMNSESNQYVTKVVVLSEEPTDVQVAGPGAASGNGWSKRQVKASAGNAIVVIVPEDVYDPYFEIRTKLQEPLAFGVQREAIHVNYLVDMKTWVCTSNCLNAEGFITDSSHFMPFTQTIQSSPWTSSEINISVFNDKSEVLLQYERTWNRW